METVEEVLHIRIFQEAFAGIDFNAAFTLYFNNDQINVNLASIEAMRLLPGLDEELIAETLRYREEEGAKEDISSIAF